VPRRSVYRRHSHGKHRRRRRRPSVHVTRARGLRTARPRARREPVVVRLVHVRSTTTHPCEVDGAWTTTAVCMHRDYYRPPFACTMGDRPTTTTTTTTTTSILEDRSAPTQRRARRPTRPDPRVRRANPNPLAWRGLHLRACDRSRGNRAPSTLDTRRTRHTRDQHITRARASGSPLSAERKPQKLLTLR